jgi:hypothetical protein
MVGTTNMNIVLGQGNAVKEVQNVKRQSLEMNQQFAAQHMEEKKNTEKSKVDTFETRNKIEVRDDDEQQKGKKSLKKKKAGKKDSEKEETTSSEGQLIDITV